MTRASESPVHGPARVGPPRRTGRALPTWREVPMRRTTKQSDRVPVM
jgi:hypothetical protein